MNLGSAGPVIIALAVVVIGVCQVAYAVSERGRAKAARTCTKHWIVGSLIPGGPDRLRWRYGAHRTAGNACDGPEHERTSGW